MSATPPRPSADDFLRIGPRIRVLPIIHGSGDFAIRVREELLARPYDCLAVPLPPSFQDDVEAAVERLPAISAVVQRDADAATTTTSRLQLRADRPVPGGHRRAPAGARRADRRGRSSTWRRPGSRRTRRSSRPLCAEAGQPRGFAAAVLPAIPPPGAGPARRADRLDGRPAARAGAAVSVDPLRLLAAGLALDSRRLPATARGGRARAVLRADPDVRRRPAGR